MNLVREIVETNTLVTINSLTNELPQVFSESMTLKESTLNYIEDAFVKFTSRRRLDLQLFDKTQKLINRVNELKTNINEVVKVEMKGTKTEIDKCQKQIVEINKNLNVCYDFNYQYEKLNLAQTHINNLEYLKAATILKTFETVEKSEYQHLMKNLQKQAMLLKVKFIHMIEDIIKEHFKYSTTEKDGILIYSMNIKPKDERVEQAIMALACINTFFIFDELKLIARKMLMSIVQHATQVLTYEQECVVNVKNTHKDTFSTVSDNLTTFVKYLTLYLSYSLDTESTLMDFLREDIEEDFTSVIVNECLDATIPESETGLATYTEVELRVQALQITLQEANLISKENTQLADFASQIQEHFVNKKIKEYGVVATVLMKKDLHVIQTVGDPYDPNDLSFNGFPQCAISKSVLELLKLVEKIIQKEITNTSGTPGAYLLTASDILTQYDSVVQEHNQRLLKTIPQQMAIFYNNCKYIAHELTSPSWNDLCRQLPPGLHDFDRFTFITQHLNDFSDQMLREMTSEQVDNIKTRIAASGISLACDKLEPSAEKTVRQCLRQQELLKTVWQKVLNYYDYNSTIGVLLDTLCTSVIDDIMKISDIPADVCEQLVDILKLIATRGPKLFTEPKEIHMYVTHWAKMNEVMFVLNSRLELIGERWADGKGPLALHFTADEMRALIRALFQNTDARAALLAVI